MGGSCDEILTRYFQIASRSIARTSIGENIVRNLHSNGRLIKLRKLVHRLRFCIHIPYFAKHANGWNKSTLQHHTSGAECDF